jgi:UDP-N-acetylmuramate dehydrogenase
MTFPASVEHLLRSDQGLAPHTWLRIGGPARYFAEPTTQHELIELVRGATAAELPIRVLGGGSNLLVRESGFGGLVISLSAADFSGISVHGEQLKAGGGARLSHVINRAVKEGLGGLEDLVGVPGSFGGAICGNASTQGGDIGQSVVRVEVLSRQGEVIVREGESLQFAHRQSGFDDLLMLSAELELQRGDPRELTKRMQSQWIVKKSQQPLGEARVALPFVDPDGASAASLIDQVGLRGARMGSVSLDIHQSAYLVAHEGATSDDVLRLVDTVREQVSKQLGVDLQLGLKIW